MGKKKASSSSSVSVNVPDFIKPAAEGYFGQLSNIINDPSVTGYTPFNDLQLQAQQGTIDAAEGLKDFNQGIAGNLGYLGDTSRLDVNSNPYLQGLISSLNDNVTRSFNEQILPNLRRGTVLNGGTGTTGSRQGIAEGIAARGTSEAIADQTAQILANQYNTQQQNILGANQLAAGAGSNLFLAPEAAIGAVGDIQAAKVVEEQLKELQRLQLIQGPFQLAAPFLGSNSTQTTPGQSLNPLQALIGGASIFTGLPGLGSIGGGIF